jgi:hypothetical protein
MVRHGLVRLHAELCLHVADHEAFEGAEMPFSQCVVEDDRLAEALIDDRGGARLRRADRIQLNVGMALKGPLGVPIGLAVASESAPAAPPGRNSGTRGASGLDVEQ